VKDGFGGEGESGEDFPGVVGGETREGVKEAEGGGCEGLVGRD